MGRTARVDLEVLSLGVAIRCCIRDGKETLEGYIPPPEQHTLGGYTTWPARSAGLEVQAEPKIAEAGWQLLEKVAGRPRHKAVEPAGPYVQAILAAEPLAYWRMGALAGARCDDATTHGHHAQLEGGFAPYLEGPEVAGIGGPGRIRRAVHFAGGRAKAALPGLGAAYTVELWFWNGLPANARPVTGYLVSRGPDGPKDAVGDHLAIGGTAAVAGKLVFSGGPGRGAVLSGKTEIALRTWHHVALVRDGKKVAVYLDGNTAPEIAGQCDPAAADSAGSRFIGGRSDNVASFEGKIDEVAVFPRALSAADIAGHHTAAVK